MKNEEHPTILRKDYRVPEYLIESISLTFQLTDNYTDVIAKSEVRKNPQSSEITKKLALDGEELELIDIRYNDQKMEAETYTKDEKGLSVSVDDDAFSLEITTRIYPDKNTSLEGLYRSSGNYCTQCEAEGFRKITYYLDRPDVLAKFTTRIEGDVSSCPVLLSNGNKIEEGDLDNGRHFAVWEDPFPKPSYLFALVAGDLKYIEDQFVTRSGRDLRKRASLEDLSPLDDRRAITDLP